MEIEGQSFWVKTKKSNLEIFTTKAEAVLSFDSMEDLILSKDVIWQFNYNPDAKGTNEDPKFSGTNLKLEEIATARVEARKKQNEE